MLKLLNKVNPFRKRLSADDILKFPSGKRIYPDFHPIRKEQIDPDAVKVIGRLQQFDHKAYLVGGCVRDLMLGRRPKDFDIVTRATPREIRRIFANSRVIGKRFEIVHVIFRGNKIIEVSTARRLPASRKTAKGQDDLYLRKDNEYGDFKEDAARRDFTINSLFYDVNRETILDYTGGFEDLKDRMVRVIGDENISLPEDPVRMLRAVKYASLLDLKLHPRLLRGIQKHRRLITKASSARMHEEYNKIFRTGQSADVFSLLYETGLFEAMFPRTFANLNGTAFSNSVILKRLKIADKMIFEHEDVNLNVYYGLLIADHVLERMPRKSTGNKGADHKAEREFHADVKGKLASIAADFALTNRETERLQKLFQSQPFFLREVSEQKGWVRDFKNRDYFSESFTLFKIMARAADDHAALQNALFWEIGLRQKLPQAIRKADVGDLDDGPEPEYHNSDEPESAGPVPDGKRKRRRRRRKPRAATAAGGHPGSTE